MRCTERRLADGREILYFDSVPVEQPHGQAPAREAIDRRDLPENEPNPQMRWDPLAAEWVAIASHRQDRTYKPPADLCPLCPSKPGAPTEIPESDYEIVVFENRFPSFATPLSELAAALTAGSTVDGASLVPQAAALGRCEVVCFTPEHNTSFGQLSETQVGNVLEVWTQRTAKLSNYPGVKQVYCFENRGEEIGVTLHHPHGQIYGYPFVTPRTQQMMRAAAAYGSEHHRHVFGDLLADERRSRRRVLVDSEHWTAFVPPAARWPVEVLLAPRRHVPDLPALNEEERAEFPAVYLEVLRKLDGLYGRELPYVAGWHQAPVRTGRDLSWLRLEIFSVLRAPEKLKYLAGSESGMQVWINDVLPEDLADRLNAV